jgi:hypothetical protein
MVCSQLRLSPMNLRRPSLLYRSTRSGGKNEALHIPGATEHSF